MNLSRGFCKLVLSLGLALILTGAAQSPQPAWASMEDAAIFYDELKDQGEWVDYGDYGPVWYPTKVQENWRPYVDGRWTPSEEGYVFETQEPWGSSTYHHGNWMPTPEYGWVWVPGRTWYPNTVNWRTSPDSEAPDTSYVGWAPIPPPNYTPTPGYYPQDYSGSGYYGGGADSLLTSPFWIFVKAASFLLGLGNPYTPAYSYWGSYAMVPPYMVPYYYTRTIVVNNYYTPGYYPAGYLTGGLGCYNWGPPIPYVARVTRINQTTINNYMQQVNIYQRRNVVPPPGVIGRHSYYRDVLPPAMVNRQPLTLGPRFHGAQVGRGNLARPNLVNASVIKSPPSIPGALPKAQMHSGPWQHGVPGAALPASAMMRPNRQMEERLRHIPAAQRLEPVAPTARKWTVPPTPGVAAVQTGPAPRHRGPDLTSATPGTSGATPPGAVPYQRAPRGLPPTMTPGQPVASQETMERQKRMPGPAGVTPGTTGTPSGPQAVAPRERFKPGSQPSPWSRPEPGSQTVVMPPPSPRQRQLQTQTPGTPPASATPMATAPPKRQPRAPWTPPSSTQQQQAPFQPPAQMHRPAPQAQPQMQRQPQAQPQMQRQPQPQPQVHRQPPPVCPPQVRQAPPPQPQVRQAPQPQPQSRPQGNQKQHDRKHQQNQ
jgi:hypothetical protein